MMANKELIESLFEDFQKLRTFNVNLKVRKKMLRELLEAGPNPWRVIGITPNALERFRENDYKKVEKLGIQRAHLNQRDHWYEELLTEEWKDATAWYEFIVKNDSTILALSGENKKINEIDYLLFGEREETLFKSNRVSWKHNKEEVEFLKNFDIA